MRFFRIMAAAILLAAAPMAATVPARGGEIRDLDGVRFEAPDRWAELARIQGKELGFVRPDSRGRLSIYWWLPDEPLLGAPDILSHEQIMVAGHPALLIHYDFYSEESLKAVFLVPRADGRQLVVSVDYPKGETADHRALLQRVLDSIRFDGEAPPPAAQAGNDTERLITIPDEGVEADQPAQAAAPAAVDPSWLKDRFGSDCTMVDLQTWSHPVGDVLARAGANRLLWLALCQDRTYPVFGMAFDYDPRGATRDYFVPLWSDMLKANGNWAFTVVDAVDGVMIHVSREGRRGLTLDEEDLPAGFAAPVTAVPPPGSQGSIFDDGANAPAVTAPQGQDGTDANGNAIFGDGDTGNSPGASAPSPGSALTGDPENLPPVSASPAPSGGAPRNGMDAVIRDLNSYLKD